MNNKEIIPIFFAIDNDYSPFVSIAISSLIEHADKNKEYHIHIVYESITEDNKSKLKALETSYAKIKFTKMNDVLKCVTNKIGNRLRADVFTLTIYFRLFLPDMFPMYDKAIYIDSDTVILNDISHLYNIELNDNLIGAVNDKSVVLVEPLALYIENYVGVDRYKYINSGLLLLNMKRLREVKIGERFLELYNKYELETLAPDQDYINALCLGKITFLDYEWDTMPIDGVEEAKNPFIVHYNLFAKPWHYDDVQYEEYFWKYARRSIFYEEIKMIKDSYTEEDKKSDKEHLNLMLERAKLLVDNDKSFKKIFESGQEKRL